MICKKCGNEVNSNEKFCVRCGEPVLLNNTEHKRSKKKIIIPIAVVCAVLLIVVIIVVSNSNNNSNTYIDNDYQYNNDYIGNEDEIQNEPQEISLADSCQYVLATGYDEDGTCYQLVGEDFEDYQGSQIRIGVIKNNAWLIEMTTEIPFIDEYNCIYGSQSLHNDYVLEGYGTLKNATANTESNFYDRFGYIGKGSFYLLGVKRHTGGYFIEDELKTIVFWNAETNKNKIINNITMDDMDNYIQGNDVIISELTDYNFRLSNDAFAELDVKSLNPETFETKKLFSKTLTVNDGMSNSVYQIGDGLIFSNGSFYNLDGKKAFDLNIKNVQDIGHFNDGKCEIITQIETGTKYRVIIDKTGKEISNEKISE